MKLSRADLTIIPLGSAPPVKLSKSQIEQLAEAEHERWVRTKLEQGWRHGAFTNKADQIHEDLVPWRKAVTAAEWDLRFGPGARESMGTTLLSASARAKDLKQVQERDRLLSAVGPMIGAIGASVRSRSNQAGREVCRAQGGYRLGKMSRP